MLTNVDEKHGLMFLPVPKTACLSIQHADAGRSIFGGGCKHARAINMRMQQRAAWNRCFKVAFVRNPWDRLASLWGYFRTMGPGHPRYRGQFNIETSKRVKSCKCFEEFVSDARELKSKDRHFRAQAWWLCEGEDILVDFVGRFESLQRDWDAVCMKVGRPIVKLPHLNRSEHGVYTSLYNDVTARAVRELYAEDIRLFGYSDVGGV